MRHVLCITIQYITFHLMPCAAQCAMCPNMGQERPMWGVSGATHRTGN